MVAVDGGSAVFGSVPRASRGDLKASSGPAMAVEVRQPSTMVRRLSVVTHRWASGSSPVASGGGFTADSSSRDGGPATSMADWWWRLIIAVILSFYFYRNIPFQWESTIPLGEVGMKMGQFSFQGIQLSWE